jgi:hypothetical protein
MPALSAKKRRKSRKQKGGTPLTNEQINFLGRLGFTDNQKKEFNRIVEEQFNENVTNMLVAAAQNDIERINPQTGVNFTPQELIDNLRNTVRNTGGGKRRKGRKGKKSKKVRKQTGGTIFTDAQNTELNTLGFTDEQKNFLRDNLTFEPIVAMNLIQNRLQDLSPQGQIAPYTQAQIQTFLQTFNNNGPVNNNVNDLSDIENDSDDEHNLSDLDDELHAILNDDDEEPMTPPPRQEGGRRRRKSRKQRGGTDFNEELLTELGNLGFTDNQKTVLSQFYTVGQNDAIDTIRNYLQIRYPAQAAPYTQAQIQSFIQTLNNNAVMGAPQRVPTMAAPGPDGGRRRRKSRKMRGGALYGTGVGANNFDPNYSIYNTRELTLFPYKPN